MARHSHWANIKHKKAKLDARRGKVWGKCAKAIMVAARMGGPDPSANVTLQNAIDEARYANMPRDTIERAIKKGAGELGSENFEKVRYEGYGPGGVAVIVDALTDNRTRTAPEMRLIFTKYGGNLGASGSVAYMFDPKGIIVIEAGKATEETLMEVAVDAGADDVSQSDGFWTVETAPDQFIAVKSAIEKAGISIASAELSYVPSTLTEVTGETLANCIKMIEALEDNDDVQKVYSNLDASSADLEAATG